jgi:hypothetical protein
LDFRLAQVIENPKSKIVNEIGRLAMYKRVMVPLDGSDLAQTALSHALEL